MASPDIKLLFGVSGGGKLDGASGRLILKDLQTILNEINKKPLELKFKLDVPDFERKTKVLQEGTLEFNKALTTVENRITSLNVKIQQFGGKLGFSETGNIKSLVSQYEDLRKAIGDGVLTQKDYRDRLAELDLEMSKHVGKLRVYAAEQKNLNAVVQQSFASEFTTALGSQVSGIANSFIGRFTGAYGIIRLAQGFKDFINTSIELESQLADLQIVTGVSEATFARYGDSIASEAEKVSVAVSDLVSATTTFARLGYSLEDSSTLAKFTGMLERVGDIDTETAEKAITSILKAFSDEVGVENAEQTMDKLVKVGNNFPISVEQIAVGMGNASSALAAAGNSFEQSVALLTAANTTVQDAAKASTGLRTIAARLRNTSSDIEGEEVITQAKYEKIVDALTKHNVALRDAAGEYRSTYDIMKDIAAVWKDMTSAEQAALATDIAGVRQQNVFYSMINQFKEAEGAIDSMEHSLNALSSAYQIYQDTTEAHLTSLKSAWVQFAVDAVDSDVTKFFIDLAKHIIHAADALAKINMLLPTFVAGFAIAQASKFVFSMNSLSKSIVNSTKAVGEDIIVTEMYKKQLEKLTIVEQQYIASEIKKSAILKGLTPEMANQMVAAYGLAAAEGTAKGATDGLTASMKALAMSNPLGAVLTVVGTVASVFSIVSAFGGKSSNLAESIKSAEEVITESAKKAASVASELQSVRQSTDELIPRYSELANRTALTIDEQKEFVELQNKLAELLPEIDGGLNSNGDHMLKLKGDTDSLTASLNEAVAAQEAMKNASLEGDVRRSIMSFWSVVNKSGNENGVAESMWAQTLPVISAWMRSSKQFLDAAPAVQDVATSIINGISYDEIAERQEDFREYLESIAYGILELDSVTQDSIQRFSDLQNSLMSGDVSAEEYRHGLDDLNAALIKAGVSGSDIVKIISSIGAPKYIERLDTIQKNLIGDANAAKQFVDSLSGNDIDIAYNIIAQNGSMTIEDLESTIERMKVLGDEFKDTMDFSDFFAGGAKESEFKKVETGYKNIADAMKQLREGTALTKAEMLKLAEQFPNLLKQSNLFTDGSIKGQKKLLQTVLDTLDKEYDAHIDTKIAELKATLEMIDEQKKLEKEKQEVLLSLNAMKYAGFVDQDVNYIKAKKRLEDLQQKNFITMQNGILTVNKQALEARLKQDRDYAQLQAEITRVEQKIKGLQYAGLDWSEQQKYLDNLYMKVATGEIDFNTQLKDSQEFVRALDDYASQVKISIKNLEDLKGSSLDVLYETNSKSKSSSDSKEKTEFEKEYDRLKHEVDMGRMTMGEFLAWLNDAYKKAFGKGTDEYRKYELEVKNGLDKLQKDAKTALDAVINYRIKMLKEAQTKEKDDLKERLNALKEFYDKQKEMLKKQLDEEKYLDEQAEKRGNVTRLREQLSQLSNDPSAVASKLRVELQKQLTEAEKELSDFERDHAVDAMTDKLDEMYEMQKAEMESQVKAIEDVVNDPTALYNQALSEIRDNSADLKREMQEYNTKNSGAADTTVVDLFKNLADALKSYNKYYNKKYMNIGYASGTNYATPGIHRIDENGTETIFQSASGGRYRLFTGGDKVLNSGDSEFLYRFATSRGMSGLAGGVRAGIVAGTQNIKMGDIIISGDASERTVSEIRRAQRDGLRELLTQLGRLNK